MKSDDAIRREQLPELFIILPHALVSVIAVDKNKVEHSPAE